MGVKARLWLLLLLAMTVVNGALSTTEEKLDQSQGQTPVEPFPELSGADVEKESPAHVSTGQTPASPFVPPPPFSEHGMCAEEEHRPHDALSDFVNALHKVWSKQAELGKQELARFGICSNSESAQQREHFSSLLRLSQKAHSENNGPGYYHTTKEHWDLEDSGKFMLTLHFSKPCRDSHQNSIMLLFSVDPINTEGLHVNFDSHSLQPNKQTVCVSKETQFLVLAAGQTEVLSHGHLKLRIGADSQNDSGHSMSLTDLQALMMRKDKNTSTVLRPLVIIFTHITNPQLEAPPSNRTFLFLCELQKFLNDVPQKDTGHESEEQAAVSASLLHSLPPLSLGVFSSESLLLELIGSSGPTVFSFPRDSMKLQSHRVELNLSPQLLNSLRGRLNEALAQFHSEVAERSVTEKLKILTALASLPDHEAPATGLDSPGENQYRAFLLLKAVQSLLGMWSVERAQRAARGDQDGPSKPSQCRLQSLTVSLEKFLFEPSSANINNCEGPCGFPLTNANNHAIVLNSHLQSGKPLNRTLCCVPVEYDDLCVIELTSKGPIISYKTNMIAKECQCR
ncbi:muellerian-inhibiting factor [Hoplias malabaricus]|uniref:muellerian-inhibiting factor n=1 Tax=Hoplias malabaricus TaxID=27720 RepID=UPI0034630FB0